MDVNLKERAQAQARAREEDAYEREAREWLANVYQGDTVRQLSPRAIVGGMLIGGLMSISNVYIGLKTGWGLGVTITSSIIAYAVFRVLETVSPRVRRDPLTILENYTMSSAASAAGYMSTSGLVSAIPALYMTTGRELAWWEMMSWLAAISMLGVFMAIPLKRQLINVDKLPFPTGLATAETLKSIHMAGAAAMAKAYALAAGGVLGAVVAFPARRLATDSRRAAVYPHRLRAVAVALYQLWVRRLAGDGRGRRDHGHSRGRVASGRSSHFLRHHRAGADRARHRKRRLRRDREMGAMAFNRDDGHFGPAGVRAALAHRAALARRTAGDLQPAADE
jgi:hypothetical protein